MWYISAKDGLITAGKRLNSKRLWPAYSPNWTANYFGDIFCFTYKLYYFARGALFFANAEYALP